MIEAENLATLFSGLYWGWAREGGDQDWEDLIGLVKLECEGKGPDVLDVTITSLEFGTWTGSLQLRERLIQGSTGQGDTYFKLTYQETFVDPNAHSSFVGGVYQASSEQLLELRLRRHSAIKLEASSC